MKLNTTVKSENLFKLNSFEEDALKELGNISSCYSLTSLSEITGEVYSISLPDIELIPLKNVHKKIEMDNIVAGIMLEFEGGLSGYMQFLFPDYSAYTLTDKLLMNEPGVTTSISSDMEKSVLKEIGNILSSAFCDALAEFLEITVMPLPPNFAFDMMGPLMEEAIVLMSNKDMSDNILLFKCDFKSESSSICGYTLLYPDFESFKKMILMLESKLHHT